MKLACLALMSLLVAASAHADVPPPNSEQCKSAGVACKTDDGKDGACKKSTCSRLDYSKGSPPQGSVDYDCILCVEGAAVDAPPKTDAPAKSTSKCSSAPIGSPAAAWLLLLGLVVLALRRRIA